MLLVDVHLVFSDDVVTLLQAVLGITFSYALLDEDTVGGVYVNSLLAVSDDSVFVYLKAVSAGGVIRAVTNPIYIKKASHE